MPLLFMSDTNEKDTLSPLEARVAFVGMMDETEGWAREVWKKNPQLKDFYRIKSLAQVDEDLYAYDNWEETREDYRVGNTVLCFYDKTAGKDVWKDIFANSRDELKKILLAEVRSLEPDPDDHSEAMNKCFSEMGCRWMARGVPTRWQEFDSGCLNPDYDGSLSWDEGADEDKEVIDRLPDDPVQNWE